MSSNSFANVVSIAIVHLTIIVGGLRDLIVVVLMKFLEGECTHFLGVGVPLLTAKKQMKWKIVNQTIN